MAGLGVLRPLHPRSVHKLVPRESVSSLVEAEVGFKHRTVGHLHVLGIERHPRVHGGRKEHKFTDATNQAEVGLAISETGTPLGPPHLL